MSNHANRSDLDVWKHFSESASTDKHTMITTVTWLLPFAIGTVAFTVTTLIRSERPPVIAYPGQTAMISSGGMAVSLLAAYVALLYAGYASRNWARADALARKNEWDDLLPDSREPSATGASRLTRRAWQFGRGVDHEHEIPPVFRVFFFSALTALLVNCLLLVWAIVVLVIHPPSEAF